MVDNPGDDIFIAFGAADKKPAEVLTLPQMPISRIEYVAKVLSSGGLPDEAEKAMGRYMKNAEGPERNAALVTIVRSIYLWEQRESYLRVPDRIDESEMPVHMHTTMLQAAYSDVSNHQPLYTSGDMRTMMIGTARELQSRLHDLCTGNLEDVLLPEESRQETLKREQKKLRIPDYGIYSGTEELAARILQYYPALDDDAQLSQISGLSDLSFTSSACMALEIMYDRQRRDDTFALIKSDIPARLKFLAALLYVTDDVTQQVGKRLIEYGNR